MWSNGDHCSSTEDSHCVFFLGRERSTRSASHPSSINLIPGIVLNLGGSSAQRYELVGPVWPDSDFTYDAVCLIIGKNNQLRNKTNLLSVIKSRQYGILRLYTRRPLLCSG